jgi:hypothetical protein
MGFLKNIRGPLEATVANLFPSTGLWRKEVLFRPSSRWVGHEVVGPCPFFTDNRGVLAIMSNPVHQVRTKHTLIFNAILCRRERCTGSSIQYMSPQPTVPTYSTKDFLNQAFPKACNDRGPHRPLVEGILPEATRTDKGQWSRALPLQCPKIPTGRRTKFCSTLDNSSSALVIFACYTID